MKVTALLLAGQRPGLDRLAGDGLKALVELGGRPMIARVVDTLLATPEIGHIVILAQDPPRLRPHVPADARIEWVMSGAGIAGSIRPILERCMPALVTTADHPLLTPATISDFLGRSGGCDVAVGVVESGPVLARFPDARRTWLRFRDGRWTGANLFALNSPGAIRALDLWSGIEQDRKKGLKIVAAFGPWLLLRALTRTISLARAVEQGGRRFGFVARAVPIGDPLAAVDVDKPEDLVLADAVLKGRA